MARIKHTKTELKAQGDALKRYQRFLPMLQLKKQQLQLEIAAITARLEAVVRETAALQAAAEAWLALNPGHGAGGMRFDVLVVAADGTTRRIADAFRIGD